MLFNSFEFLVLLAVTLVLYYLPIAGRLARVWQVGLLLVASSVFYGWENPRLLILLAVSCVANSLAVERILFWKGRDDPAGRSKKWLTAAIVLNLVFLAFFKYAGIIYSSLPGVCGLIPARNRISARYTFPIPLITS